MNVETVEQDLQRYVGVEAEPPRVARFPVDAAMIRQWCEALGDDNPIHLDAHVARAHGRVDIVCPPAMVSTWIMSGYRRYREVQHLRVTGAAEDTAYSRLMTALDEHGFTSVVATDIEQQYHSELVPGTRVTCRYTIDAVSPRKRTALGDGHFLTLRKEYVDQDERPVATELFRMLRFAPPSAPTPRRTGVPPLVRTQDNAFWFEGAADGRLLIQRCADCGQLRHPPGPACPVCRSFRWDAVESTGRGTLHSWTIVHHPHDPAFGQPVAVGLIDLEEGTRLVADVEPGHEESLEIGARVHVVFGEHAHGEILPRLRRGDPVVGPESATPSEAAETEAEEVPEGTVALPLLQIPLDRTAIMAGAIASQDYEDVHHDPGRAAERGMRDIFLSINTTNGYVDRYLAEWGGPSLRIDAVRLRLGVPQFAGDVLELVGAATPLGDGRMRVEIVGRNTDGVHVTATATVSGVVTEEGSSR